MPEFELNQQSQSEIDDFIEEWFAKAPEIMGISESIAGCEVTNVDTYGVGVGVFPRYVTVRIYEYTVQAFYRGFPTIILNDLVTVLHFREGNRYEVIGISGSTGSSTMLGGTGLNTQVAYWTAATTLAGDIHFTYDSAGGARLGAVDNGPGTLHLSGSPTGPDEGGEIQLDLAVDWDGVFESWIVDVYEDDLRFWRSDAPFVNLMRAQGSLVLPIQGVNGGVIIGVDTHLYREAANVLYTPDTFQIGDGIIFSGGSGANELVIPDNLAIAWHITDDGVAAPANVEYMRIITVNAGPAQAVIFNEGGVDVDFRIEAVGHVDAFEVQGSDGQITLGILTAGYVKSNAGGVLSVALEVPLIDLGSYTPGDIIYGGAADYQDLAIGAVGEVLTVNLAGTEPEWAAPAGIGVEELHEHAWQEDWTAACNGVNVNFITANEFSERTTLIHLNGSLQRAGTDYTEDVLFNSVTFTVAPIAGDELITAYELA